MDDFIGENKPIRVVDAFVGERDLQGLGFEGTEPAATGRPSYHLTVLLKIYICGYLDRLQSGRRLEREAWRNIELMWLESHLAPDFKTIADFGRDIGKGIRTVCRRWIEPVQNLRAGGRVSKSSDQCRLRSVGPNALDEAQRSLHMPKTVFGAFIGQAALFRQAQTCQLWLIVIALAAVLGSLLVSQLITLFITPALSVCLHRLGRSQPADIQGAQAGRAAVGARPTAA